MPKIPQIIAPDVEPDKKKDEIKEAKIKMFSYYLLQLQDVLFFFCTRYLNLDDKEAQWARKF